MNQAVLVSPQGMSDTEERGAKREQSQAHRPFLIPSECPCASCSVPLETHIADLSAQREEQDFRAGEQGVCPVPAGKLKAHYTQHDVSHALSRQPRLRQSSTGKAVWVRQVFDYKRRLNHRCPRSVALSSHSWVWQGTTLLSITWQHNLLKPTF